MKDILGHWVLLGNNRSGKKNVNQKRDRKKKKYIYIQRLKFAS